ncbi:uncharacterized protein BYT42DRAFT_632102 [Radiomyces spectabilis]|uniref:uncharacterized protein n=1 Tax=Radiomyces spectabilis TaxID=64574 RepID=UPI002220CBCF|nr:uncharacterized protein BYT42DRAFT_632102 [Radiomyces spectabilis]KAI8388857.1 hypothetical protein BYT42DRAFT_632102 [Radiomyces spectabilis]
MISQVAKVAGKKKAKVLDEDVPYVDSLAPIEQRCLEGRCVLVDLGRRDLLFCMHEYSEPNARIRYRYTSCQKANELKTKKYRRIRETLLSQFPNVKTAQEKLSQHPISVNDLETYCHNLRETASVSQVLSNFYANITSIYRDTLFSENYDSQPISINAEQILDWREP